MNANEQLAEVLENLAAEIDDLRNLYTKWCEVVDELLPYAQRSYIGPLRNESIIKATTTLEEHRKAAGKARHNAKHARSLVSGGNSTLKEFAAQAAERTR